MEVSVMAKVDNTFVAGNTFTDENGKFQLPVTSFEGEVEAVFQIRRGDLNIRKMLLLCSTVTSPLPHVPSAMKKNIHSGWTKTHGSPFPTV